MCPQVCGGNWIPEVSFLFRHYTTFIFFFMVIVLLDIFFIYISNVFPFPGLLFGNLLSHPPTTATMRVLPLQLPLWGSTFPVEGGCSTYNCHYEGAPPTHPFFLLSALAFPYTGASNPLRPKGHLPYWCPTRLSSATYASRAMVSSLYILWLVV